MQDVFTDPQVMRKGSLRINDRLGFSSEAQSVHQEIDSSSPPSAAQSKSPVNITVNGSTPALPA